MFDLKRQFPTNEILCLYLFPIEKLTAVNSCIVLLAFNINYNSMTFNNYNNYRKMSAIDCNKLEATLAIITFSSHQGFLPIPTTQTNPKRYAQYAPITISNSNSKKLSDKMLYSLHLLQLMHTLGINSFPAIL